MKYLEIHNIVLPFKSYLKLQKTLKIVKIAYPSYIGYGFGIFV